MLGVFCGVHLKYVLIVHFVLRSIYDGVVNDNAYIACSFNYDGTYHSVIMFLLFCVHGAGCVYCNLDYDWLTAPACLEATMAPTWTKLKLYLCIKYSK